MGLKGVIGAGFLLLGGAFFVAGGYMLVEANRIVWSGAQTTGMIVGHETRGGRGGRAAVYAFKDKAGREVQGSVRIGSRGSGRRADRPREAEVGRKITVFYNPTDPRQSVPDTFMGRWGAAIIMGFALPFMLIGFFAVRSDRREEGWGGDWEPE